VGVCMAGHFGSGEWRRINSRLNEAPDRYGFPERRDDAVLILLLIGFGIAWQQGWLGWRLLLVAMRSTPLDTPEQGQMTLEVVAATRKEMTAVRGF